MGGCRAEVLLAVSPWRPLPLDGIYTAGKHWTSTTVLSVQYEEVLGAWCLLSYLRSAPPHRWVPRRRRSSWFPRCRSLWQPRPVQTPARVNSTGGLIVRLGRAEVDLFRKSDFINDITHHFINHISHTISQSLQQSLVNSLMTLPITLPDLVNLVKSMDQ